jgi:hypothetical protein
MSRKLLLLAVGVGAVLVCAATLLPVFNRATNCGGNSAALFRVQEYALMVRVGAMDSSNHIFQVNKVMPEQRQRLAELAHYYWIPGARFLVSTAPWSEQEPGPRRIIIVCDTPYRNVPQRWIGSSPPAHAVGYSDGSTGLISPAEFAALDRSLFAFLDELFPATKPETPDIH